MTGRRSPTGEGAGQPRQGSGSPTCRPRPGRRSRRRGPLWGRRRGGSWQDVLDGGRSRCSRACGSVTPTTSLGDRHSRACPPHRSSPARRRRRGSGAGPIRIAGGQRPGSWDVLPRPYPAAYARLREAEALVAARGDRAVAAAALGAARATATRLGAAPLLGEIAALASRASLPVPGRDADPDAAVAGDAKPGPDVTTGIGLTAREREVLSLLALGGTNRQIAEALFISSSTAGVHVSHIIGKLRVASRGEAASLAYRLGIVDAGPLVATSDPPRLGRPVPNRGQPRDRPLSGTTWRRSERGYEEWRAPALVECAPLCSAGDDGRAPTAPLTRVSHRRR